MPAFQKLWSKINHRTAYVVDFDTDELIHKSIVALDAKLRVSKVYFKIETGSMDVIESKEALQQGSAFTKQKGEAREARLSSNRGVKYDLIGRIVEGTKLTRKAVVAILRGIKPHIFNQFAENPEEFIIKASDIINDEKATAIIQHITYNKLNAVYDTSIFTEPTMKGQLGMNAMKAQKHLYDYLIYDSAGERDFAAEMDTRTEVAIYVKLPHGFYINTPVGRYNPDWAIAFQEDAVKHIYFVAETKDSMSSMDLRPIERAKIDCAKKLFATISSGTVQYDHVDNYEQLMNKVMQ